MNDGNIKSKIELLLQQQQQPLEFTFKYHTAEAAPSSFVLIKTFSFNLLVVP
jgi:hypothetical protein